MKRDRREEILFRLLIVLQSIVMLPPLVYVVRNQAGLPDEQRPALIMLDADEIVTTRHEGPSRGGLRVPPQLMAMSPQIFYLAGDLPENQTIGQHLNAARIAVMNAIIYDDALLSICGTNGSIYYGGCETDMKTGSSMLGQMQINPVFIYPFVPTELRAEGA